MSSSLQKKILVFLVADLVLSVCFLLIAKNIRSNRETASALQSNEESQKPIQYKQSIISIEESAAARRKHEADNRLAAATKARIKEEVSKQTDTYENIHGTESWITLEELKNVSPEAYEQVQRELKQERKKSKAALTKRKQFMDAMKPGILPPEDFVELKEALEFLNECDQNIMDGRPIQDRSADYDSNRKQRLRAIAQKISCAMAECPEDIVERQRRSESIANSNWFSYKPVVSKELNKFKRQ
ncbi:MAG: hypothetical protein IKN52_14560 [Victivallales bacterium]|nr:hypothetical protein [Victivallales bacterium]